MLEIFVHWVAFGLIRMESRGVAKPDLKKKKSKELMDVLVPQM